MFLTQEEKQKIIKLIESIINVPFVIAKIIFEYYLYETIYSTCYAFAAKLADGRVVTWDDEDYGGDSSAVQYKLKNVETIYSTFYAFAAVLADGSVVTWGDEVDGGDSSAVQDKLKNVKTIYSTGFAFAAVLADGSVITWGYEYSGGDSSAINNI